MEESGHVETKPKFGRFRRNENHQENYENTKNMQKLDVSESLCTGLFRRESALKEAVFNKGKKSYGKRLLP